jgi:hypothetical protein
MRRKPERREWPCRRASGSQRCVNSRSLIQAAALGALAAKLLLAALTRGTNDVDTFYNFGRFIWEHGLLAQYRASAEFNHPPATGWFCALLYGIGGGLGFHFLLRLPGILADFAVVRLLARRPGDTPPWALVLLALSPVSLMVSGFHGNVDSVLVWLLALAAIECERGRPGWCGLWLGLACQVKIIPLLLAPVFFFHWMSRRNASPFFTVAALTILAGWSVPLVTIPAIFLHNVLGYGSNWGAWGVTWWLTRTGAAVFAPVGFSGLTTTQLAIMSLLKVVIVGSTLALAWRRRSLPGAAIFTTLALVWTVFFVFAPGVGTQYLVWAAPFLLMQNPRGFALITAAGSAFCFAFYQTICGGFPWDHGVSTAGLVGRWSAWSNVPWLAFVALLAVASRYSSASSSSGSSSPSESSSGGSS